MWTCPRFTPPHCFPARIGAALLIGGIDGKVQLVEDGGSSRWPAHATGAAILRCCNTGCGAGAQIIASGSGEAASDSLRAYELPGAGGHPGQRAAGHGRHGDGAVAAPDGKSVFAVVRKARQTNMRWTVLRQVAISCLLAALALPAAARTRPHYGGTLRVEIEGDPWQRPGGSLARRLVFDGLTRMDADGTARSRPWPCEWESENNDHRWQFWLRPGVRFHDGSALTSAAVKTH
jgi:hypothetical protein